MVYSRYYKVEIIYYQNSHKINCYYQKEDNKEEDYIDFTFVFKFLYNENDYIRSGNQGYIKGKPLLIGEIININVAKYENDFVFPID